jgi:hypothetical protein
VRVLPVLLAVLAAAVAVAGANIVLLGYGSERNEHVGKLSPLARMQPSLQPVRHDETRDSGTALDD